MNSLLMNSHEAVKKEVSNSNLDYSEWVLILKAPNMYMDFIGKGLLFEGCDELLPVWIALHDHYDYLKS